MEFDHFVGLGGCGVEVCVYPGKKETQYKKKNKTKLVNDQEKDLQSGGM